MKKSFSGFYSPSNIKIKNAWTHEKTLFVFDTNVLLNLYSYTEDARNDFFKILEGISDRIWLPNHVGLEYQRNRLHVIKNEKHIFKKFANYLENIEKTIENQEFKDLKLDKRFPKLHQKSIELHKSIQNLLDTFKEDIEKQNKKQPDVRSGDKIRKKLEEYFDNKIGCAFPEQNILDDIYKEGKSRYDNNIPPGYKDAEAKKDDKAFTYGGLHYTPMYGDLIIWKQIIEEAKTSDIKSVLFVTDDTKEDWWYTINSSGKKRIGVRSELREEIEREAKVSLFEVMTTSSFMEDSKKYLELDVSVNSIEEVEEKVNSYIVDKKYKVSQLQKIIDQFTRNNDLQSTLKNTRDSLSNSFKNPSLLQEVERIQRQQKEQANAFSASYKNLLIDNVMLDAIEHNNNNTLLKYYKEMGIL